MNLKQHYLPQENAYALELESQIIISDGETNWIYLIDRRK